MLILSRKVGEEIVIGGQIKVTVLKVQGGRVRLGIEAPKAIQVLRRELRKHEPILGRSHGAPSA
ncbi:MAG: carbon storage regulator CsrA [Planctomycetes bacterium]|nr:carbon storage regulator CsrA [Planctomycetota bacterium]MBL7041490.1 carbon storage regulator CsrA [Pirellulaceae bacterium]